MDYPKIITVGIPCQEIDNEEDKNIEKNGKIFIIWQFIPLTFY